MPRVISDLCFDLKPNSGMLLFEELKDGLPAESHPVSGSHQGILPESGVSRISSPRDIGVVGGGWGGPGRERHERVSTKTLNLTEPTADP